MSFLKAIALKSQKEQEISKTKNDVRVSLETNAESCESKSFIANDFHASKKQ